MRHPHSTLVWATKGPPRAFSKPGRVGCLNLTCHCPLPAAHHLRVVTVSTCTFVDAASTLFTLAHNLYLVAASPTALPSPSGHNQHNQWFLYTSGLDASIVCPHLSFCFSSRWLSFAPRIDWPPVLLVHQPFLPIPSANHHSTTPQSNPSNNSNHTLSIQSLVPWNPGNLSHLIITVVGYVGWHWYCWYEFPIPLPVGSLAPSHRKNTS